MEQVADEDALRADEAARHVEQPFRSEYGPIQDTPAHGVSGGRQTAFLCTIERAEILALLEARGGEARADLSGSREITCLLDLYHDIEAVQDVLRRVVAGETLQTESLVGGRVFETHLVPVRNEHHEITSILCIAFNETASAPSLPVLRTREEDLPVELGANRPEAYLQALLDAIPDRLFLLNRAGVVLGYKDAPGNLSGVRIGAQMTEILPSPVAQHIFAATQRAQATGELQVIEDGLQIEETVQVIEVRVVALEHDECLCLSRNITEHTQLEQALRTSQERYRTVIANAPIVLFATDTAGVFTLSEGRGLHVLGLEPGQVVGRSAFEVYRDFPQILDALRRALAGETLTATLRLGELVFETQYTPLRDAEGHLAGVIGVATNISERAQAEEALRHQALHDTLTDLPNRTLLLARMAAALPLTDQTGGEMALLLLDLDRFKGTNDTFGHQCGDQLLQQVGVRLRQAVSAPATVARLGGDEFAVFLPTTDEASAQQVASALGTALEEAFLVEGYPLQVEVSIGIARYPAHGSDPVTLLRHADVAMYTAKRGHERYALYDAQRDQYSPHRLALLGDLRQAIATDQLRLSYQPQAELSTGEVSSVEALLRWQHPSHGLIPPDQFLPLAEQTGLIESLTGWVLETAVEQCRYWLDGGITLGVAANLSMWNLRDASLPDTIAGLLARYRVPSHLLRVEITESAVMADVERTRHMLHRLRALGVRIAIDDFGTGYASLSYLKRLPADELKIDRAFVQHLATDGVDQAIVQSTVTMAHSLGMRVVAEGVEDQATWNLLATLGCDSAQGYYLSRPLSARELQRWLADRKEAVAC